jgi:hypothetical protein
MCRPPSASCGERRGRARFIPLASLSSFCFSSCGVCIGSLCGDAQGRRSKDNQHDITKARKKKHQHEKQKQKKRSGGTVLRLKHGTSLPSIRCVFYSRPSIFHLTEKRGGKETFCVRHTNKQTKKTNSRGEWSMKALVFFPHPVTPEKYMQAITECRLCAPSALIG